MPNPRAVRRNLDIAIVTIEAIKLAKGCIDCGYRKHPAALQFDHRDPSTKRTVEGWVEDRSKLRTRVKLARFLEHVEACCDVRCANCHAVRSITEKHWRPSTQAANSTAPTIF